MNTTRLASSTGLGTAAVYLVAGFAVAAGALLLVGIPPRVWGGSVIVIGLVVTVVSLVRWKRDRGGQP